MNWDQKLVWSRYLPISLTIVSMYLLFYVTADFSLISSFPLDQRLVFTSLLKLLSISNKQIVRFTFTFPSYVLSEIVIPKTWDVHCVVLLITGSVIWWHWKHKSHRTTLVNPVCAFGCTEWRLIWQHRLAPLEEAAVLQDWSKTTISKETKENISMQSTTCLM